MKKSKDFVIVIFGWYVRLSFEKVKVHVNKPFRPRITKKKANSGLGYCDVMGKVSYPEALAKLKAEQGKKRTVDGYLRAYHCEFCPSWHLTHHKNKLTMH